MEAAGELAGFFAAHAVWCVSDGEVLIPLVGYETLEGQRLMQRMTAERIEDGVAEGKAWMAANPELAARAVLIFDAFVTLESGRTDALIVLLRDYTQAAAQVTIAVPYRSTTGETDFAVHRPKTLEFDGIDLDPHSFYEAFWRGVFKHEQGSKVWDAHLDQSR
jgi:hypothetical protein